jgi:hypothetical protein
MALSSGVCQNAIVLALSIAGHCILPIQASADHPSQKLTVRPSPEIRDEIDEEPDTRRNHRPRAAPQRA